MALASNVSYEYSDGGAGAGKYYKYSKNAFSSMKQSYEDFGQSVTDTSLMLARTNDQSKNYWISQSASNLRLSYKSFLNDPYRKYMDSLKEMTLTMSSAVTNLGILQNKANDLDGIVGVGTELYDEIKFDSANMSSFTSTVDTISSANITLSSLIKGVCSSVSGLVMTYDCSANCDTAFSNVHKVVTYKNELVEYGNSVKRFDANLKIAFENNSPDKMSLSRTLNPDDAYQNWLENLETLEANGMSEEAYYSAVLNSAMYMNFFDDHEGYSFTELPQEFRDKLENGTATLEELVEELSKFKYYRENEYMDILSDAINMNPSFGEFQIKYCSRLVKDKDKNFVYNEGSNGILFQDPVTDAYYVSFRGTSDGEWLDDGLRFGVQDLDGMTEQMKQCVSFFDSCVEKYRINMDDTLYVTGHSQGGNDAQVALICSQYGNLIDICYAMDGEGQSPDLMNYLINVEHKGDPGWFNSVQDRLYMINSNDDPVHRLGMVICREDHMTSIHNELGQPIEIIYEQIGIAIDDFYTYHIAPGYQYGFYDPGSAWGYDLGMKIYAIKSLVNYIKNDVDVANIHDIKGIFGSTDGNGNITYSGKINQVNNASSAAEDTGSGIWAALGDLSDEDRHSCEVALMQVVEIATGGNRDGVNGETASKEDMEVLYDKGVPLIAEQLAEETGYPQGDIEFVLSAVIRFFEIKNGVLDWADNYWEVAYYNAQHHVYPILSY